MRSSALQRLSMHRLVARRRRPPAHAVASLLDGRLTPPSSTNTSTCMSTPMIIDNPQRIAVCPIASPLAFPNILRGSFSTAQMRISGVDDKTGAAALRNLEHIKKEENRIRERITRNLQSNETDQTRLDYTSDILCVLQSYQLLSEKAAEEEKVTRERATSEYADMADDFLRFIENSYMADKTLSLTTEMYLSVMFAYDCFDDPQNLERVLRRMLALWEHGNSTLQPDRETFHIALCGWSKNRTARKLAIERIEGVIIIMEELCKAGHTELCPDTASYNELLQAHARVSNSKAQMTYAKKAGDVLGLMMKRNENGRNECRPDLKSFNIVMNAIAKARKPNSGEMAEDLLIFMDKLRAQKGYEHISPNIITYTSVINAHSGSGKKDSAKRAEAILKHMMKLCESGMEDCRPDLACFTAVLRAWAKSKAENAPQQAQRLFHEMIDLKGSKAYEDLKPNTMTYNTLMSVIAHSAMPDKALQTFKLFQYLDDMGKTGSDQLVPDKRSHMVVLQACALSCSGRKKKSEKSDILRITQSILDRFRQSPQLRSAFRMYISHVCTIAFAVGKNEGEKLMRDVFQLCCQDGKLDIPALNLFRKRFPKRLLEDFLGPKYSSVDLSDLPPDWSRNVGAGGRRVS